MRCMYHICFFRTPCLKYCILSIVLTMRLESYPTHSIPAVDRHRDNVHEQQPPYEIDFFITDHNLRSKKPVSVEEQRKMYAEMKGHGLSSIRFDWDWKEVIPHEGERKDDVLERYAGAIRMMQEVGMKPPTLVLSNPPEWAAKLYRKDKEAFFQSYADYIATVVETLRATDLRVEQAQLFNEINHSVLFKYVDIEDLPRLAGIARYALCQVQPDIQLSTSLIVSSFNDALAKKFNEPTMDEFFAKHRSMLQKTFDRLSLDYYPGTWHFPMKKAEASGDAFPIQVSESWLKEVRNRLNRTFKNMDELKRACEVVAGWGKEYEIGEVGFSTNEPYSDEKRQRFFYDMFFRGFRQMLIDLRSRGVALPKRVGVYETQDEENISFGGLIEKFLQTGVGKFLSRLTPNPEHDFGLKKSDGQPKKILQGRLDRRGKSKEDSKLSQLRRLIQHVKRPLPEEKKKDL